MKKEWRDIKGYEGLYQVSNYGEVYNTCRNKMRRNSRGFELYLSIRLSKQNKQKRRYVHHLVLETFVGPRPKGYECNHIDENKLNNRLDNLEWVTKQQNMRHSYYQGSKSYNHVQIWNDFYSTPIIALHSGKWYPSQRAAELELGLRKGWITEQLQGLCHKRHFYQFKKV